MVPPRAVIAWRPRSASIGRGERRWGPCPRQRWGCVGQTRLLLMVREPQACVKRTLGFSFLRWRGGPVLSGTPNSRTSAPRRTRTTSLRGTNPHGTSSCELPVNNRAQSHRPNAAASHCGAARHAVRGLCSSDWPILSTTASNSLGPDGPVLRPRWCSARKRTPLFWKTTQCCRGRAFGARFARRPARAACGRLPWSCAPDPPESLQ